MSEMSGPQGSHFLFLLMFFEICLHSLVQATCDLQRTGSQGGSPLMSASLRVYWPLELYLGFSVHLHKSPAWRCAIMLRLPLSSEFLPPVEFSSITISFMTSPLNFPSALKV